MTCTLQLTHRPPCSLFNPRSQERLSGVRTIEKTIGELGAMFSKLAGLVRCRSIVTHPLHPLCPNVALFLVSWARTTASIVTPLQYSGGANRAHRYAGGGEGWGRGLVLEIVCTVRVRVRAAQLSVCAGGGHVQQRERRARAAAAVGPRLKHDYRFCVSITRTAPGTIAASAATAR